MVRCRPYHDDFIPQTHIEKEPTIVHPIRIARNGLAKSTHEAQRPYDLISGMLGGPMKRLLFLFGLVVAALAVAPTPASAQSACSLSGAYVGTITVLKPSLVSGIGTFTFTPFAVPPGVPCIQGVVSLESALGSVQGVLYNVVGGELNIFLSSQLIINGLVGQTQGLDGAAQGFVFTGAGVAGGQVVSFGGTAIKANNE